MTRPFSVLVTDGSAKHSIALQRYLRRAVPDIHLISHAPERFPFCRYQRGAREVRSGRLQDLLIEDAFDMVIPVSGMAVRTVARICPHKAVIAPEATIERCLNKGAVFELAADLRVPHPRTWAVTSLEEIDALPPQFPCVIKPGNETELKDVDYARNFRERHEISANFFARLPSGMNCGLLIQEQVRGVGRGFFAVYDQGKPIVVFMHERIREMPPSGGASTAARAIYDENLKRYGLQLLDALEWHGPAMVEFKYDPADGQYNLIEINPKLWGSLELGLSAGINFGQILVRLFKGEDLVFSDNYDRKAAFAWPLDGDLETIFRTGKYSRVLEYFRRDMKTNVFQSLRTDIIKLILIFRSILRQTKKGN
jgi:hypothetical protein